MSDGDPPVKEGLPKPTEVLDEIAASSVPSRVSAPERDYLRRASRDGITTSAAYEHLRGIRDHYEQKKTAGCCSTLRSKQTRRWLAVVVISPFAFCIGWTRSQASSRRTLDTTTTNAINGPTKTRLG